MSAKDKIPQGIADPAGIRNHLDSLDCAILGLAAVRTRLMFQIEDAFSDLNTTAQLWREIFYGIKLPVNTPKELIKQAGGQYRLIQVSFKERGSLTFALVDVIAAIPKFKTCFPIKRFDKLAKQLEDIREEGGDLEATWFVKNINNKNLDAALANEVKRIAAGNAATSPLTRVRQSVTVQCACGGPALTPAQLIAESFREFGARPGAGRWTGMPETKARVAKASGRSRKAKHHGPDR